MWRSWRSRRRNFRMLWDRILSSLWVGMSKIVMSFFLASSKPSTKTSTPHPSSTGPSTAKKATEERKKTPPCPSKNAKHNSSKETCPALIVCFSR